VRELAVQDGTYFDAARVFFVVRIPKRKPGDESDAHREIPGFGEIDVRGKSPAAELRGIPPVPMR
jgi:hypothetical protein